MASQSNRLDLSFKKFDSYNNGREKKSEP